MSPSNPITLNRDCDAIEIPVGTRTTLPSGTVVRVMQSRGGSHTVSTNFGAMYRIDAKDSDALGTAASTSASAAPAGPLTEQMVVDQLKTVFDPEIPVNIVDLGLVYGCAITALQGDDKKIDVKMTMTAPGCGMGNVLKSDVEGKLASLPQVKEVHVEIVFDPPWSASRMSDAARLQLGLDLDEPSTPFSIFPSSR
jgi:probable FeS assembly SUF system protein SufT